MGAATEAVITLRLSSLDLYPFRLGHDTHELLLSDEEEARVHLEQFCLEGTLDVCLL